ncbi:hypothetical protein HDU83_005389 [Entophlyctis luteolus]|nr:hypothetical protein HDU82_000775 [Entophlyctis luteolus]KAJ3344139.1 hypothetical protein HDU83_005389 [Entophlyctis luteolus]KAJ3380277.1 hypothetical protein HDU84_006044 [Entophlyctis sp. JEL0112]
MNVASFRVLCVGASLTEGYDQLGLAFHPYAISLRKHLLNAGLIASPDQVVVDGLSGDFIDPASGTILRRMQTRLDAGEEYAWVVLLAGTNDIGYSQDPQRVLDNLDAAWSAALSARGQTAVLAVTLPDIGYTGAPFMPLRCLNDLIRQRVQKRNAAGDAIYLLDLHAQFPLFELSTAERARLWGDHVHPTAAGYDVIGQLVFESIVSAFENKEYMDSL